MNKMMDYFPNYSQKRLPERHRIFQILKNPVLGLRNKKSGSPTDLLVECFRC